MLLWPFSKIHRGSSFRNISSRPHGNTVGDRKSDVFLCTTRVGWQSVTKKKLCGGCPWSDQWACILSAPDACGHDDGMMRVLDGLMGGLTGSGEEKMVAHQLASLLVRLGGLGLRSAVRLASAAFWSSWADALHMIHERLPRLAADTVERLDDVDGCVAELRNAADGLDRQGFVGRPSWVELQAGVRPPPTTLWSRANGLMAGSSTRLLLPCTIFGRRWFLLSHVPATRHI